MRLMASSLYLPQHTETNEAVIEFFEQQNVSMQKIQSQLGRGTRHVSRDVSEDNTFSMAVESARQELEIGHLTIRDIDLILFVTSTPEQLVPCGSLLIHHALEGAPHTMCYDLTANFINGSITSS